MYSGGHGNSYHEPRRYVKEVGRIMITTEKVCRDMVQLPVRERKNLFAVIARQGFEKDRYFQQEIFDDIRRASSTTREAAKYLEI